MRGPMPTIQNGLTAHHPPIEITMQSPPRKKVTRAKMWFAIFRACTAAWGTVAGLMVILYGIAKAYAEGNIPLPAAVFMAVLTGSAFIATMGVMLDWGRD